MKPHIALMLSSHKNAIVFQGLVFSIKNNKGAININNLKTSYFRKAFSLSLSLSLSFSLSIRLSIIPLSKTP